MNKRTSTNVLHNLDILSLDQFTPSMLSTLFKETAKMSKLVKAHKPSTILSGKVITLVFFEPSSRTFSSFASAIKRLGGATIEHQDPMKNSSAIKGETIEDTIKVFEAYSDAIVIRHPQVGTAKIAADAAEEVPIFNAGDGIGEHPTQALMDMYTIYEKFGKLDNLTGVMAGDLLNGRTTHSLLKGLSLYKGNTIYLLSPKELRLSKGDFQEITNRGVTLIEIGSEKELPKNAQFWYWTRVQKERFATSDAYEKVKNKFIVTTELMKIYGNKDMILMHPLPRVGEIEVDVDADPRAVYLRSEIRNGMYLRMALLSLVLG